MDNEPLSPASAIVCNADKSSGAAAIRRALAWASPNNHSKPCSLIIADPPVSSTIDAPLTFHGPGVCFATASLFMGSLRGGIDLDFINPRLGDLEPVDGAQSRT